VYQLVRLAQLIGLNAVPGFGFFALHWTTGTVIAIYWCETLLGSILVAIRIDLHRRLTHKRGHYVTREARAILVNMGNQTKKVGTILSSFLITSLVFTLAEGVFLAVLLGQLPESEAVDPDTLRFGLTLTISFLIAGFAIDLLVIRQRPFFWIHRLAGGMLGRVMILFFVVYIGMAALIFLNAPRATVIVFMVLKTFIDIASELPESQTGEAPQWQLAIASLFGPSAREKFAAFARDANREYGTYAPEDEEQMQGVS